MAYFTARKYHIITHNLECWNKDRAFSTLKTLQKRFINDFYGQLCLVQKTDVDAFIDYMITINTYLAALMMWIKTTNN